MFLFFVDWVAWDGVGLGGDWEEGGGGWSAGLLGVFGTGFDGGFVGLNAEGGRN